MNKFCEDCLHNKYPKSLKDKFNKTAEKIFVEECPLSDPKVVGCTTKRMAVDWFKFISFLKSKNMLTSEEEKFFGPNEPEEPFSL